ncbi:MAG: hypothetical protein ABFC71_10205 [Methanoregula sp.]
MVLKELDHYFGIYRDLVIGLTFLVALAAITGFKLDIPTWFNSLTPEGKFYSLILLDAIFTLFVGYVIYSKLDEKIQGIRTTNSGIEIKPIFLSEIRALKIQLEPIIAAQTDMTTLSKIIMKDFGNGMPKFYPNNGAFHLYKEKIPLLDFDLQSKLLQFYQKITQASECHQQIFQKDPSRADYTKIQCFSNYLKEANDLIPHLLEKLQSS